jgi:hypothetical protein
MRISFAPIAAACGFLTSPAEAQITVEGELKRFEAIDAKTVNPADCQAGIAKAAQLNAPDAFHAAMICRAAKMRAEGNFLIAVGHVRALYDMTHMAPATVADRHSMAELYGLIYGFLGGPGDIEVLREPALRARFFALYDAWEPVYSQTYDPGWNAGRRPDAAIYLGTIRQMKVERRSELERLVRLYSDPEYYAADKEMAELSRRNPKGIEVETPDGKRSAALMERMRVRAAALGVGPEPAEAEVRKSKGTPPVVPGKDEKIVASSTDPAVKECVDWGENYAAMSLSTIVRVLITTGSGEWGPVWRADVTDPEERQYGTRLICSKYGTMVTSTPDLAPLPGGGS